MIRLTERTSASGPRLGERLIACGLLTENQLAYALDIHERSQKFLGETVVDLGFADEFQVGRLVASELGLPYRDLHANPPQPEALALVSRDTVFATRSIPTGIRGEMVEIAMVDPLNRSALNHLTNVTGRFVIPNLTMSSQWEDMVGRHYRHERATERALTLPVEEWREIGSTKCLRRIGDSRRNRDHERERLFEQLQPLVRKLVRRYGRNPDLREELQGEIYLQFCNLYARYDPSRQIPLHPYMIRMLTAGMHTYARRVWRTPHGCTSLCDLESIKEVCSDPTSSWDDELEAQVLLNALPGAIAELPERQRHVLIARYYYETSFEELAKRMQIQPATARSLLRHAIKALRSHLVQVSNPSSNESTARIELPCVEARPGRLRHLPKVASLRRETLR